MPLSKISFVSTHISHVQLTDKCICLR